MSSEARTMFLRCVGHWMVDQKLTMGIGFAASGAKMYVAAAVATATLFADMEPNWPDRMGEMAWRAAAWPVYLPKMILGCKD